MNRLLGSWDKISVINSNGYTCSYCNKNISSNLGFYTDVNKDFLESQIYICHECNRPTFFDLDGNQFPGASYGNFVDGIESQEIISLYTEARSCISVNAFTASVLCSRKLLMNIAVSKNAEAGKSFAHYVDYLNTNNYIPPGCKDWVDHIRKKGNEATHEIHIIPKEDAIELIDFTEMLMKFIFEFPSVMASKYKKK